MVVGSSLPQTTWILSCPSRSATTTAAPHCHDHCCNHLWGQRAGVGCLVTLNVECWLLKVCHLTMGSVRSTGGHSGPMGIISVHQGSFQCQTMAFGPRLSHYRACQPPRDEQYPGQFQSTELALHASCFWSLNWPCTILCSWDLCKGMSQHDPRSGPAPRSTVLFVGRERGASRVSDG